MEDDVSPSDHWEGCNEDDTTDYDDRSDSWDRYSDGDGNFYIFPYLPPSDHMHDSVAERGGTFRRSDQDVTYIFPVPPINCDRQVVGLRYCYANFDEEIDRYTNQKQRIFTLLVLEERGGRTFEIINTFPVCSMPTSSSCERRLFLDLHVQYCCDTVLVKAFQLPEGTFAFGMKEAMPLLRYHENEEFLVEHYRVKRQPTNNTFYMLRDKKVDETLRIFQFILTGNQ
jgi:hypothetical protein